MCCGMRNPGGLKVRRYAACLVDIDEYLNVFPGANISDKSFVMEINEILLNSILNI